MHCTGVRAAPRGECLALNSRFHCHSGHDGIVGAQADVADPAALLQFFYIPDIRAVHGGVPTVFRVDEVDHSQVDAVCLEPCRQILKRPYFSVLKFSSVLSSFET